MPLFSYLSDETHLLSYVSHSMAAQVISNKLGPVSSGITDLHGATIATAKPFPTQTASTDGLTATASGYGILR